MDTLNKMSAIDGESPVPSVSPIFSWIRGLPSLSATSVVSVVVIVRNGQKVIAATMDSLISQTYWNIEFIVIDDCSDDESACVVERYAANDARVRLYRLESPRGDAFCRNLGVILASGNAVMFVEQGEVSVCDRVARQLRELHIPGVVVCSAAYEVAGIPADTSSDRRFHGYLFRRETFDAFGFFDEEAVDQFEEYLARLVSVCGLSGESKIVDFLFSMPLRGVISAAPADASSVPSAGAYITSARKWHAEAIAAAQIPLMEFPLLRRPFGISGVFDQSEMTSPSRRKFSTAVVFHNPRNESRTKPCDLFAYFERVILVRESSTRTEGEVIVINSLGELGPMGSDTGLLSGFVMFLDDSYEYQPSYFRCSALLLSLLGHGYAVGVAPLRQPASSVGERLLRGAFSFSTIGFPVEKDSCRSGIEKIDGLKFESSTRLGSLVSIPVGDMVSLTQDNVGSDLDWRLGGERALYSQLLNPRGFGEGRGRAQTIVRDADADADAASALAGATQVGATQSSNMPFTDSGNRGRVQAVSKWTPLSTRRPTSGPSSGSRADKSVDVGILLRLKDIFRQIRTTFNAFEKICVLFGTLICIGLGVTMWTQFGVWGAFAGMAAFGYLGLLLVFLSRRVRISASGAGAGENAAQALMHSFRRRLAVFLRSGHGK